MYMYMYISNAVTLLSRIHPIKYAPVAWYMYFVQYIFWLLVQCYSVHVDIKYVLWQHELAL